MSFLDNLENNLKALENRDERDTGRDRAAQEARKVKARELAPVVDALRTTPFTGDLIAACRVAGHARRIMVRPTWIDTTFRLEAGTKKLELQPTPEGVQLVFFEDGAETAREKLDLKKAKAQKLAERWLG